MKVVFKALKVLVVTWTTLAVTASGVSGMVLCFGADGHFALEMSHQGRCQEAEHAPVHGGHAVAEMFAGTAADCCGDCVDVSLSLDIMARPMSESTRSLSAMDYLARVMTAASPGTAVDCSVNVGMPRVLQHARLRVSPALLAQRTVVLQI